MLIVHNNPTFEGMKKEDDDGRMSKSPPWSPQEHRDSGASGSPHSLTFSWRKFRQEQQDAGAEDDNSDSSSPPLWRPGSSMYSSSSIYSSQHLSVRAQEIAKGRQEMMKLYEGMPESAYELSLRDLVEQKSTLEKKFQEEKDSEVATCKEENGGTKVKKAKRPRKHGRKRENGQRKILLNIFVPRKFTIFPHSSPSPLRLENDGTIGHQSKKGLDKEPQAKKRYAVSGAVLSIFRHLKPSKHSAEVSPSNSFSYAFSRSQSGRYTHSEVKLPAHKNISHESKAKQKHSNRCSMCSGYTVFFQTKCEACSKIYCSNCVKKALSSTSSGPRCKDTCAARTKSDRDLEYSLKGCWPHMNKLNKKTRIPFRETAL